MKLFHLIVHQKTFSEEDLLINPKDYQEAKEGDIVEIFHPSEDDNPRLLLQIKAFKDDLSSKDTISIEQSIAAAFGLRNYKDISMRIVNPADVALDSIELTFKDQYMGRSEMWRLKNSLINTCVYMNKKIEFCGGAVRCQVYEMWSQGDRVACGVITDDTKVVFRSSTSMVYLFLQMSSEMWDFNIYGDLYFEKAVNGFLSDLFMKWKKNGSNHEVTIVLFSRTFYKATSLEEFPLHMRECLQKDYKGRYYEDFYRVAVQNERYEDWSGILVQLRRLFSQYLKIVLEYHSREGEIIPAATNSTAAQGNFLEVLNMSLNVFEKHYLDRSFDRTGQLSVVITPGVGVFEVDRELTNITKQRIIDNGVGSDLVCVGEQPLHAVPLLKFHNKDTHFNVPDDYSMPHWINLSFYSTNKKVAYSNFIPRIKLPPSLIDNNSERCIQSVKTNLVAEEDYLHNSFFDYDAYDAQVFQIPAVPQVHEVGIHKTTPRYKRGSGGLLDSHELCKPRRKLSDPDIQYTPKTDNTPRSQPIVIPSAAVSPIVSPLNDITLERDLSPPLRMVIGSEGSPPLESRALINPFDPSHVTIKLTSNRRRWTHIFPKGPTGVLIQQHHYQAVPAKQYILTDNNTSTMSVEQKQNNSSYQAKNASLNALIEYCRKEKPVGHTSGRRRIPLPPKNISKTFLWGATGEQEWTPAITTVNEVIIGVDWKSLTIPACLPITTDYFPDKRALQIDYVVSLYNLLPDDVNAESQQKTNYKKPLTTIEVFQELISQRLAQGFQLILMPSAKQCSTSSVLRKSISDGESTYSLSIGRLFHKITLSGNAITVTRYRPRHPYPGFNYQYRYRFHTPHHDTYEESYASFTTEKLEHYNWNYLDHYICTRGDTDFSLVDALKYWRFRVYLLPLNNAATKRIIEGSHCDIYGPMTSADHQQMVEGFLKFIESVVNRIRRPNAKKPRMSLSVINHNTPLVQPRRNSMSAVNQSSTSSNSPFRERLGSNRLPDRPRPRSGSKVMEKGRASPAIEILQQHLNDAQSQESGNDDNIISDPLLRPNASSTEILEAMKQPINGLGLLPTHQSLPQYTFISSDAINWLITHMEGVTTTEKAIKIFTTMQRDKLICHASGDITKPFVQGFFLYYIVYQNDKERIQQCCDLTAFQNDWMEVEVKEPLNCSTSTSPSVPNNANTDPEEGVPHFLRDEINPYSQVDEFSESTFRRMLFDIDSTNKSDRVEWGHVRYQTTFRPDQAYELVVEWLVASGSIVSELLHQWARKVQAYGLQMVPIPNDPLALPYSDKSDPLRGPIFVPLNIDCLDPNSILFKEFRGDTYTERLFLLQEAILYRFGFIPCLTEAPSKEATSQEYQYIHCTGTVFILISSPISKSRNKYFSEYHKQPGSKYTHHADIVPSPHEAYITRHVSGKNKNNYDKTRKMGFLWSWNYMISKRWRTNQVDTNFQLKLLKDFREFCSNVDNRLKIFWNESWELKNNINTKNLFRND
ncbi:Vacuolar membrane-associated protein Iml1 [Popillia japonica]|uniref:Vacuolar membrane-associated protein Iml1 n=1 Tax=Popillia japonica TaxID=7064 RepID=A0AAW1IE19_POPJA